jgi:methylaspartate mutase epsilon subunit
MPARDADGYLRIVDPGLMPFPREVLEIHEEKLRRRAERERVPYGPELAVSSVYEMAEPMAKLLSDKWAVTA